MLLEKEKKTEKLIFFNLSAWYCLINLTSKQFPTQNFQEVKIDDQYSNILFQYSTWYSRSMFIYCYKKLANIFCVNKFPVSSNIRISDFNLLFPS